MASMTLVELMALNSRMNIVKTAAMPIWTRRRSFSSCGRCLMSTQKLVVSAVSAESAEENAAASTPMVKSITTAWPSSPEAANIGSRSSPCAGSAMPSWRASIESSMPSERKSRLAGRKAKP